MLVAVAVVLFPYLRKKKAKIMPNPFSSLQGAYENTLGLGILCIVVVYPGVIL